MVMGGLVDDLGDVVEQQRKFRSRNPGASLARRACQIL